MLIFKLLFFIPTTPIHFLYFLLTTKKRVSNDKKILILKNNELELLNQKLEIYKIKTNNKKEVLAVDNTLRLIQNSISRLKRKKYKVKILNWKTYSQELNLKKIKNEISNLNKRLKKEVENLKNLNKFYFQAISIIKKMTVIKDNFNKYIEIINLKENDYLLKDIQVFQKKFNLIYDQIYEINFSITKEESEKLNKNYKKSILIYQEFLNKFKLIEDNDQKIIDFLNWCIDLEVELSKKKNKDNLENDFLISLRKSISSLNVYKKTSNYVEALYCYETIREDYDKFILK